ncbi:glutathione S-transferase [Phaeosphaeriaceae sp. SRC1lsM3a]|nr:glutathione S-transferase [Stagonospora sp. SRC1lsM3a]
MAPKLHLYMSSGACSLAPHIALREAGLEFTTTEINAKRGFPTEYLHLNPKGRVPILDFDGELITETPAILSLISDLAPEKKLLGTTLLEQARAREWLAYLSGTLHGQGFGCLFRPKRFVGDEESMYDQVKATGRQTAKDSFALIEEKLQGRTHAVGDAFTLVDANLLVFYRWGNFLKFGMAENYPSYTRLVEEVVKREAVQKTVEAEGINALE